MSLCAAAGVVPILAATRAGEGVSHRSITVGTSQEAPQQGTVFVFRLAATVAAVGLKYSLNPVPQVTIDYRIVYTIVELAFTDDFASVQWVR